MARRLLPLLTFLGFVVHTGSALAGERAFVYTQESRVLPPGHSELEPWTTFRVGRERYYSALDARLELERGLVPGLQLALYWNFTTQSQDVVLDSLTSEIERVSSSEFASASLEVKYQLTDPVADALGSALYLETTLGPRESELEGKLIFDRALGKLLIAGNLTAEYELEPVRGDEGSELETALVIEPSLALALALPRNFRVGVELRAPLGVAGEADSAALFGGPVASWADSGFWLALGVQPQLVAFSQQSPNSQLDLSHHERLQVRLLAGFSL